MKKRIPAVLCVLCLMLSACGADTIENEGNDAVSVADGATENVSEEADEEVEVSAIAFTEGIYSYGGEKADGFESVAVSLDEGTYVAVGCTESYDIEGIEKNARKTAIIAKFDNEHNLLWNKGYGGDYDDCFMDVVMTADGGCIAVGYKYPDRKAHIAVIVKYDAEGNIIWEKEYGTGGQICFNGVAATPDGGVVAAGYIYGNSISELSIKGARDALLVKFDGDGNVVWQQNYGGSMRDEFAGVSMLEDGSLVAVGTTYSTDIEGITALGVEDTSDAIVVKYDTDGNMLFQKNYGGSDTDCLEEVALAANGDIVAVGYSYSKNLEGITTQGTYAGYIVCMDAAGEKKWHKAYGDYGWNTFNSVSVTTQGDYYVAGYAMGMENAPTNSAMNAIVLKYDAQGNLIEETPYFGDSDTPLNKIVSVGDGYIIAGKCAKTLNGLDVYYGATDALRIIK